jgi:hypothetical protein
VGIRFLVAYPAIESDEDLVGTVPVEADDVVVAVRELDRISEHVDDDFVWRPPVD